MTVVELARILEAPHEGDGGRRIDGAALLEAAGAADLAFFDSSTPNQALPESAAGCVVVGLATPNPDQRTVIRVAHPRNGFARAARVLVPPRRPRPGVHPSAVVDPAATLGQDVSIGPCAVIEGGARVGARAVVGAGSFVGEGSRLGDDSVVHPGVIVYHGVSIGHRSVLHSGTVIGADGFGLVLEGDHYEKFPQLGGVRIGDDVEIGANCCVDRGALGDTWIDDGAKLDNMVHIGHNCRIGKHVVMAAQCGLSGGVVIEDYVVAGGQVGIGEKARVGAKAVLGGQCGLLPHKTLPAGKVYWGTPARPHREQLKKLAAVDRLPEVAAEIQRLRRRIEELEKS